MKRVLSMKLLKHTLFLCANTLLLTQVVLAQDCADPEVLCAEAGTNLVNPEGPAIQVDCFDAAYTSILQITTNTTDNPGTVTINVEEVNCGNDTLIEPVSVALLSFDAFNPCDQSMYEVIGDCQTNILPFSFESPELDSDTDYFVVVGSNLDPAIYSCETSVSISGSAVDIDACCDGVIPLGDPWPLTVIGGSNPPGPNDASYTWSPTEFLEGANTDNPTAYPEETTNFIATGTVGDCTVTDIVTVTVGPPINIPNTITPNGDLVNDLWLLAGIERFEACEIVVYDRWGQQVFKSIGYPRPWDGTRNGTKLATATYYYVIELNSADVNIAPITGSITLIH